MFSGTGDKKSKFTTHGADMPSIIAKGLVVTGDLRSEGELQVDGIVIGNILAEKLSVGDTSHITGDIDAEIIVIRGKIDGNLRGGDITIAGTASVKGDVINKSLTIEPGAIIDGHCSHSDTPRERSDLVINLKETIEADSSD
jgi:cytoskeletal protein CcmA (bactofilin family)